MIVKRVFSIFFKKSLHSEDVLNGKRLIPMGCECEIENFGEGSRLAWHTIHSQRGIHCNHCAIVDAARAGGAARIRLDGKDQPAGCISGVHLDSRDAVLINISHLGEHRGDQAQAQEVKTMKYRLDNGVDMAFPEGFV